MKKIFSIVTFSFLLVLLFAVIYPLAVLGIAQLAPNKGKGETISVNGKVVGYSKIGQKFNQDKYFWGRPSAVDYNASGSAGSNKGPTNKDYLKEVETRIDTFLLKNPTVKRNEIPSEMVTASGSGLDPDISIEGAKIQVKRIADNRKISEEKVLEIIQKNAQKPLIGMFGPIKINVLVLNTELDNLK